MTGMFHGLAAVPLPATARRWGRACGAAGRGSGDLPHLLIGLRRVEGWGDDGRIGALRREIVERNLLVAHVVRLGQGGVLEEGDRRLGVAGPGLLIEDQIIAAAGGVEGVCRDSGRRGARRIGDPAPGGLADVEVIGPGAPGCGCRRDVGDDGIDGLRAGNGVDRAAGQLVTGGAPVHHSVRRADIGRRGICRGRGGGRHNGSRPRCALGNGPPRRGGRGLGRRCGHGHGFLRSRERAAPLIDWCQREMTLPDRST